MAQLVNGPALPTAPVPDAHGFFPSRAKAAPPKALQDELKGDLGLSDSAESTDDIANSVLKSVYEAGREIATAFEDQCAEINKNEDLSEAGKVKQFSETAGELLKSLEPHEKAVQVIDKARHRLIDGLSAAIQVDNDISQLEQAKQLEHRAALERLDSKAKGDLVLNAALKRDDLSQRDVDLLRAVTSVPAYFTGVSDHVHEKATNRLLQHSHGPQIAVIKALDDKTKAASQSVEAAKRFIQQHATVEHQKAAGIAGPFRREMNEIEKVQYVKDHGKNKFLALPW